MHAQHQNFALGKPFQDAAGGNQTAHTWQGTIHDDYLGSQLLSYTQGLVGVPGFTHNTNVVRVFQHAPESPSNEAMVIDQQYRNLMHSVLSDVPVCSEPPSSSIPQPAIGLSAAKKQIRLKYNPVDSTCHG